MLRGMQHWYEGTSNSSRGMRHWYDETSNSSRDSDDQAMFALGGNVGRTVHFPRARRIPDHPVSDSPLHMVGMRRAFSNMWTKGASEEKSVRQKSALAAYFEGHAEMQSATNVESLRKPQIQTSYRTSQSAGNASQSGVNADYGMSLSDSSLRRMEGMNARANRTNRLSGYRNDNATVIADYSTTGSMRDSRQGLSHTMTDSQQGGHGMSAQFAGPLSKDENLSKAVMGAARSTQSEGATETIPATRALSTFHDSTTWDTSENSLDRSSANSTHAINESSRLSDIAHDNRVSVQDVPPTDSTITQGDFTISASNRLSRSLKYSLKELRGSQHFDEQGAEQQGFEDNQFADGDGHLNAISDAMTGPKDAMSQIAENLSFNMIDYESPCPLCGGSDGKITEDVLKRWANANVALLKTLGHPVHIPYFLS